ncbi:MAG: hypothetical protein COB76_04190 [Alphaproteobacteria bacterium]|nr:MAG: hypothetical protein COB76_04190 [Alphaproteobacteria bacterium]
MRKFLCFISVVFILLLLAVGFNYTRDPLRFFHSANDVFKSHAHDRYSVVGKLRSSYYSNLVIGSSHSLHFTDEILGLVSQGKWLNAAVAGSTAYEQYLSFSLAKKRKEIKTVIWEIRLDAYIGDTKRTRLGSAFPISFYQDTLQGDAEYLLSLDTFLDSLFKMKRPMQAKNKHAYGKDVVANALKKYCDHPPENGHRFGIQDDEYSLSGNIETTIEKAVAGAPDTLFKIFFPPYSILNHAYLKQHDVDEYQEYLKFRNLVVGRLSLYPNVHIYDFQTNEKIITDMEHYRDLRHYDVNVYKEISKKISLPPQGVFINESDFIKKIDRMIEQFDYTNYKNCLIS